MGRHGESWLRSARANPGGCVRPLRDVVVPPLVDAAPDATLKRLMNGMADTVHAVRWQGGGVWERWGTKG